MKNKKNKLGLKIILARKEKGYTQKDLAEKMYCSRQTIMTWEAGTVIPSSRKVSLLSKVLGKDISFFLPPDVSGDVEKIELFLPAAIAEKIRKSAKKEHLSESDFIRQVLETWPQIKK